MSIRSAASTTCARAGCGWCQRTRSRDDPLRTLRLARLACELDFDVDAETAESARASVAALARVAPERVFAELKRIVAADGALAGLELMDAIGVTEVVLPELSQLHGVEQSRFHHLDVYEHTRVVLAETIALEREPERWFPEPGRDGPAVPGRAARQRADPRPGAAVRGAAARRRQAARPAA